MLGRDAFQETDIIGITQPITKHSILVEAADELADAVRQAIAVATEGRPGPVLVDVPKDVQTEKAEWDAGRGDAGRRDAGGLSSATLRLRALAPPRLISTTRPGSSPLPSGR